MTARHVGARLKRPDDPRLLTGRGRYLDDLTLPRMAHVAFVRSPHAHAVIAGIECDAARLRPRATWASRWWRWPRRVARSPRTRRPG